MAYQVGNIMVPEIDAKAPQTGVPSVVPLSEAAFVDLYVEYTRACLDAGREPLAAFYFMISQGIRVY